MKPLSLPDGRYVLPGNRWDLLDGVVPPAPPRVSVIIPYYQAQDELDQVLAALTRQTHPPDRLELVIADDGSTRAPDLACAGDLSTTLVRQPDKGFRAGAARNLGARAATGEVLCFLDGDTVPEPDYVRRLCRLPALVPDALVTGRRRHGQLAELSPEQIIEWLTGRRPPPVELTEPEWLRVAQSSSANLLQIGPSSYQYVISAVIACSAALFAELAGFDDSFTSYGGEDWEFAHRALCAGAVLAHIPDAVAWHSGPDWGERGDADSRRRQKATERAALAERIPRPNGATPSAVGSPNVSVELEIGAGEVGAAAAAIESLLAPEIGCGIWLSGPAAHTVKQGHFSAENRVAVGPVDPAAARSVRIRVTMTAAMTLSRAAWSTLIGRLESAEVGEVVVTTARATLIAQGASAGRRCDRWSGQFSGLDVKQQLFGRWTVDLDELEALPTAVEQSRR
jgi:GT2 family glycosyltransferase